MSAPITVHQVIDDDTFAVNITFDPARVIIDAKRGITVVLTPLEAALLDHELYEAASPPEQCDVCENYAVTTVDGVRLCYRHAHAHDQVNEATS